MNTAKKDDLMSVQGIGNMTAKRIIKNRPCSSVDEVIEKEVVPEATLKSLGFDSFGMVELMFALEDEFRVEITDEMLGGIKTVGDIIAGLYRLCGTPEATS